MEAKTTDARQRALDTLTPFFENALDHFASISPCGAITCKACIRQDPLMSVTVFTAGAFINHFEQTHLHKRPTATKENPHCSLCGIRCVSALCSEYQNYQSYLTHMVVDKHEVTPRSTKVTLGCNGVYKFLQHNFSATMKPIPLVE